MIHHKLRAQTLQCLLDAFVASNSMRQLQQGRQVLRCWRHIHTVLTQDEAVFDAPWLAAFCHDCVADLAQALVILKLGTEVIVESERWCGDGSQG
jgi:ABC-type protease/lipase transport system fused ATPase/permease subunit